MTVILNMTNFSLQLAIHVVQNRHAGEQKLHWDKTKQKTYIILNDNFLCLSCPSATFALSARPFCTTTFCIRAYLGPVYMEVGDPRQVR